jgi:hypothetical protein
MPSLGLEPRWVGSTTMDLTTRAKLCLHLKYKISSIRKYILNLYIFVVMDVDIFCYIFGPILGILTLT